MEDSLRENSIEDAAKEKLVVKKTIDDQLLLEGTDDYEEDTEELLDEDKEDEEDEEDKEEVEAELLGAEATEDGQHEAEDRFFLGTLAKLFRGQASSPSNDSLIKIFWGGWGAQFRGGLSSMIIARRRAKQTERHKFESSRHHAYNCSCFSFS